MKAFGLRSRKSNHEKVNTKRKREGKDGLEDQKKETRKEKKSISDGRGGTSDRSQETKSNVDGDLSSSEDESWNKYEDRESRFSLSKPSMPDLNVPSNNTACR